MSGGWRTCKPVQPSLGWQALPIMRDARRVDRRLGWGSRLAWAAIGALVMRVIGG